MVRLPRALALGAPTPGLNSASSAPSTSVTLRLPVSVRLPLTTFRSSVTAPLSSPLISAPSLTPVMVMVTVWLVPSRLCTVKVSTLVSPAPRYCTLSLATS
ncbi:hypothetical protein D3C75_1080470 [compost metagenome]